MKTYQDKIVEFYSKLAKEEEDPALLGGRHKKDEGVELDIISDIFTKLDIEQNNSILDLGCGCGLLTHFFAKKLDKIGCKTTFFDIPEVIKKLKKEIEPSKNFTFEDGVFPQTENPNFFDSRFDKICIYGVLQYSDRPEDLSIRLLICLIPQEGF